MVKFEHFLKMIGCSRDWCPYFKNQTASRIALGQTGLQYGSIKVCPITFLAFIKTSNHVSNNDYCYIEHDVT